MRKIRKPRTGNGIRGVPTDMKHIVRRSAASVRRLSLLGPALLALIALIVAACNNGSGGTGY